MACWDVPALGYHYTNGFIKSLSGSLAKAVCPTYQKQLLLTGYSQWRI